jgi:hypothetical protein
MPLQGTLQFFRQKVIDYLKELHEIVLHLMFVTPHGIEVKRVLSYRKSILYKY